MSLTLRFALQFATAAGLAVALAVGASFALFAARMDETADAMRASFTQALEARLRGDGDRALEAAVAETTAALAAGDRMEMMAAAMKARAEGAAGIVRVYGAEGRALADGEGDPAVFERPAPAPARGLAEADGVRRWREGDMLFTGRAVCPEGRCAGVVVVALSAEELTAAQGAAADALAGAERDLWLLQGGLALAAIAAGALFAGMVGAALARRFSRSMEAAVEALEKVAAGDFAGVSPMRDAHLADLAHAVDMVAAAMAEAVAKGQPPETSPLIADIPDGLFVAAPDGAMLVANPALHALFGADEGALLGADVFETFGAPSAEGAEAMAGALRAVSEIARAGGETVPVMISARPTGAGEEIRVVGVAREVEARAGLDAEALADAEKRANAAQEAKEKFLSVMSHELRTPLNGILGGAAILAGTDLDESQRGFLSLVQSSGKKMMHLVTDILDYSRAEEDGPAQGSQRRVEMDRLAGELAQTVAAATAEKGLELYVRAQPGLPPVIADMDALHGIGEQLVDNAVKFTQSGHVGVEVTHKPAEEGSVEITLAVSDSGPGVPPEVRDSIFDAFSQGDGSINRKAGGTGLGLSIARRLAKRLGADIAVDTATGGGSTFSVAFKSRTDGAAPESTRELAGSRTLVMNPVRAARDALRETLGFAGADVTEAASLDEAERALDGDAFDLVVAPQSALDGALGAAFLADLENRPEGAPPIATLTLGAAQSTTPHGRALRPAASAAELVEAAQEALRAAGRDPAAAEEETALTAIRGGRDDVRVLLADPNDVTRAVLETYLRKSGFEVHVARDGVKAVAAFKDFDPHLLLIDLAMPTMSGVEATKAIRRHEKAQGAKEAPIIALVGKTREGERERCATAGVSDFLATPVRTEDLEAKLDRWLTVRGGAEKAAAG